MKVSTSLDRLTGLHVKSSHWSLFDVDTIARSVFSVVLFLVGASSLSWHQGAEHHCISEDRSLGSSFVSPSACMIWVGTQ